ncbi:MAG TPA: hypothetical protein VIK14_09340, partial [Ignavibacteria bacterium]
YLWIGHLAFITLFVLASVFCLERVIFIDSSGFAFRLIYDKHLQFTVPRYASTLPQVLPLVAVWLHLPLKIILFIFSVSYIVLYYLIFLLTAYLLKQPKLALVMPFVLLIGVQYSFFWCVSEISQANIYAIFFLAFLYYSQNFKPVLANRALKYIGAVIIMFLSYFSHPAGFFSLTFVLVYYYIGQKLWRDAFVYTLIALLLIAMVAVVFVWSPNGYDSERYSELFAFYGKLKHILKSYPLIFIFSHLPTIYLFSLIIFILTIVYYIKKKKIIELLFYSVYTMVFLLIVLLTFDGISWDFMTEKNLAPFSVLVLIPFFHELFFQKIKFRYVKPIFLLVIIIYSSSLIVIASRDNLNRLNYIKHLTDMTKKFPEKKFIIQESDLDFKTLLMGWALGTESLLLTSLESPDSSTTIYMPGKEENIWVDVNDPDIYMCASWAPDLSIRKMDKNLFNLGDKGYRKISTADLLTKKILHYQENFENPQGDAAQYKKDSSGNTYFIFSEIYGPGYNDYFHNLTKTGKIYVKAFAKIKVFDEIPPDKLGLIITRQKEAVCYDIYYSFLQAKYQFSKEKWTEIFVSGSLSSSDPGDIVKVYIWNPDKYKVMVDDVEIDYFEYDN